jgi:hypothetical protein
VRETALRKTALPRGWVDLTVSGWQLFIKIAHRDGAIHQVTAEFDDLEGPRWSRASHPRTTQAGHNRCGRSRSGGRRPAAGGVPLKPYLAAHSQARLS